MMTKQHNLSFGVSIALFSLAFMAFSYNMVRVALSEFSVGLILNAAFCFVSMIVFGATYMMPKTREIMHVGFSIAAASIGFSVPGSYPFATIFVALGGTLAVIYGFVNYKTVWRFILDLSLLFSVFLVLVKNDLIVSPFLVICCVGVGLTIPALIYGGFQGAKEHRSIRDRIGASEGIFDQNRDGIKAS